MLTCQAWFSYQQNSSISRQASHIAETEIPILIRAHELKLAVVQVQQWLTDISATRSQDGLNDGFDEAAANAERFKSLLEELSDLDKDNTDKYRAMQPVFDANYETGRRMAQAYIDQGPSGGNRMMANFDAVAAKMAEEIDIFLKATNTRTQQSLQQEVDSTQFSNFMLIFVVIAMSGLVAFSWFVLRGVQKQLGADPSDIRRITDAIANGDLNLDLSEYHDNAIGVLASLLLMRDNLSNSIEQDRLLGANIDRFHKNPAHQQHLLKHLNHRLDSGFEIGSRSMKFVANPVINAKGKRLGTVVEWTDNTAQIAIQNEIEELLSAAQSGDLSRSITLGNKKGFFLDISGY